MILTIFVFLWGLPSIKALLNGLFAPQIPIEGLDKMIERVAPVVSKPTKEGAVYGFTIMSRRAPRSSSRRS